MLPHSISHVLHTAAVPARKSRLQSTIPQVFGLNSSFRSPKAFLTQSAMASTEVLTPGADICLQSTCTVCLFIGMRATCLPSYKPSTRHSAQIRGAGTSTAVPCECAYTRSMTLVGTYMILLNSPPSRTTQNLLAA